MKDRGTLLLRAAIAFAFLYPPADAVFHPDAWLGFFPQFLLTIVSPVPLLYSWGIVQAGIGLWILSGKRTVLPSIAAATILCAIVLFNIAAFEIVFRDISLALVAAALAWESYTNKKYGTNDSA